MISSFRWRPIRNRCFALGTKEPDKRHVLYDGGHRNLVTRPDLIGESLDWFDKYLGPVDR